MYLFVYRDLLEDRYISNKFVFKKRISGSHFLTNGSEKLLHHWYQRIPFINPGFRRIQVASYTYREIRLLLLDEKLSSKMQIRELFKIIIL